MDKTSILISISDKLPADKLVLLKQRIDSCDDESVARIATIAFKNNILALVLGVFLGFLGIDRFYKGDIALGIGKLVLFIISMATFFIFIGFIFYFILVVWTVVDWYFVWKGIKEDNFKKVMLVLS